MLRVRPRQSPLIHTSLTEVLADSTAIFFKRFNGFLIKPFKRPDDSRPTFVTSLKESVGKKVLLGVISATSASLR